MAALILSIKTGLILGASRLGARALVLTAAGFGGGLFLLTMAFAGRRHLLVEMLDRYTFIGAVLVALALIYLGLQEPAFATPESAGGRGRLSYFLGFLPCPFCMAALAFSVIIIAPRSRPGAQYSRHFYAAGDRRGIWEQKADQGRAVESGSGFQPSPVFYGGAYAGLCPDHPQLCTGHGHADEPG